MNPFPFLTLGFLVSVLMTSVAHAEERTLTPEQMEALANNGDFTGEEELERPKNLPDLTKGERLPTKKAAPPVWTLGPTGIVGQMAGRAKGDQILVRTTVKGSPSEGKFLPGDVIIGMNGEKFVAGGDMGIRIGNAIVEAEKEENGGKISFIVWRDRNLPARSGKQNVTAVDVDELFAEALDDNSLYDWKPEEERAEEVKQMSYDKYPIEAVNLEIDLKLRTLPAYADTAPYDCPKTRQILEEAWQVLEKKFIVDPKDPKTGKGGVIEAIALVASGKPEHRKLVHDWVRSKHSPWNPPTEPIGEMFKPGYRGYKGYQSWHKGYAGLYCAIYYDATGDEYVLPALRKYAIETAMGQSWAGSWGHTFAYPSFNGGELHQMNPGYGALNAAGNRCFFLVTLAQKLGIKHPEIDQAVERARNFFGSYTDQGCIPYGDHPAYGSDDSNGKNTGVAFSMKLLGDKHKAKYFAMMSSHCAFTRRGGHGHDYHGNWSSWAATLCGPEIRMFNERNLRWRRTLCRLHDGSFIYNSPTSIQYGPLRDPTATEVLHQSVIFGQTLITGKDPDPELFINEHEMKQMISIARGQFNDPLLIEMAGKTWPERTTDEMFDLLNVFYPKTRGSVANTLAKRFQEGEKEILPRLLSLLDHEDPRFRDGALRALGSCGNDVVLENLSKISRLLEDPEDFVRITTVKVISKATDDEDTQLALLKATVEEPKSVAPNSVRNATQGVLFGKDHLLAKSPFDAGFDEALVRTALEAVMLTDPDGTKFLGSREDVWTKDTIVKIAGPLTFIAEEEQIADQMFGNRSKPARAILEKAGYLEALESTVHRLRKKSELPRHVRPFVGYKDPLVDPFAVLDNPGAFRGLEDAFRIVLIDNPNESLTIKNKRTGGDPKLFELDELLASIDSTKSAAKMPKVADDVRELFRKELDQLDGSAARIEACRVELADPEGKNTFRKIAAMETLVEMLDVESLSDLAPFLGHSYWRLRDRSRGLASDLTKAGGMAELVSLLKESGDPKEKTGILAVIAATGGKSGIEPALSCLKDDSPVVRAAAASTLTTLGGESELTEVLAHFVAAREPDELSGFEEALLAGTEDPIRAATVRDRLLEMLPGMDPMVKASAWYVLAKIGDPECIAALAKATKTDSFSELDDIVLALSYSPSREADRVLLDIAAIDKKTASIVGPHSVRRMVLGPKGYGDITDSERMDFAEPMIKLSMDPRMITYLSGVLDARALRTLIYCLKQGVGQAAESLVSNAEKLENLKPADSKIAVEAVQNVIEYIEVTHLRGGVMEHMRKEDKYYEWKELQARAGRALLKLHNPETVPIPTFDPLELER